MGVERKKRCLATENVYEQMVLCGILSRSNYMKDISLESPSYPGELRGILLARRLGGESLRYSNRLRAGGGHIG